MRRLLLLPLLLLVQPAWSGLSDRSTDRAVDLVERLFLYPDDLDATELLEAAAMGLAEEVDWLLVSSDGRAISLSHGDGTPLGEVTVASLDTLPEALRSLEALVVESGHDTGDVDLSLALLQGLTDGLDRHSKILSGDNLERFDVRLKGTLEGIGATLHIRDRRLRVKALVPGGPAELGGVRVGDVIERVDGTSTLNMSMSEALGYIRGDAGTEITLELRRGEELVELTLERAEVVVPNVHHEVLPGPVAYIEITHFSQRTVENMVLALDDLRSRGALTKGLLIDLRGNTGGSMKQAARSADLFLKEGVLLRTVGPDGGKVQNLQARMDATDAGNEPPIPIVVLVNQRTASGSEILAGTLMERARAALVGSRTYGKGTVQKIYTLEEDARFKLTVARYLVADDHPITEEGIVPDVVLAGITLDDYGVRYSGWHEDRSGVRFEDIIPVVEEEEGWRGAVVEPGDVTRELARRAVLRALGPTRRDALLAIDGVVPEILQEQEQALATALEAKGMDWSPAQAEGPAPVAQVQVRAVPDPTLTDVIVVAATVDNLGDADLARALVQLECDSFGPWDGLVVPVGRVAAGEQGQGTISVPLRPGYNPREDEVRVLLRTDQRPTGEMGTTVLGAASSEPARVSLRARLELGDDHPRAEVTVDNLTSAPLTDVELAFAHPGELDVELLDATAFTKEISASESLRLDLGLKVGPEAPEHLPMALRLRADRYGTVLKWPVDLPTDGSTVTLEAPRISVDDLPLAAPVGPLSFPVRVVDDGRVDHAVYYVDGVKVGWAGDERRDRLGFEATVQLEEGANTIRVVAEDDQGIVARRTWVVRGLAEAAVDAGGDTEE